MTSFIPTCPITQVALQDPVKAPDGHSYERSAISHWLTQHGTSPLDPSRTMTVADLVTDYTIKSMIDQMSGASLSAAAWTPSEITATQRSKGPMTQIKLSASDGLAGPQTLAFVVDISGSMNTEVTSGTGESDGYSILDIVKQAIKVCLLGLRDQDRACIIVYSTRARVLFPMSYMNVEGKARARVALAGVRPENCTNIWDGLQLAMDQMQMGGTIYLMTDGQPNVSPPRGEVAMLQSKLDGRDDIDVHTFGFGYGLDSKLLYNLARATHSSYSFIPDTNMVGTVFVHAMANLLVSTPKKWSIKIETTGTIDRPDAVKTSWGYLLPIGRVARGQSRDIFFQCDRPVSVTIDGLNIQQELVDPESPCSFRAAAGIFRCYELAVGSQSDANMYLNELIGTITDPKICEDLNGQVREAIATSAFCRWGRHYLLSLACAHASQQCNNFKDPGVQEYGGGEFGAQRDAMDEAFSIMPAPTPTHRNRVVERARSSGRQVSAPLRNLSSYNSSSAPCFAGSCRVQMANGEWKACHDIRKGDKVMSQNKTATVQCVLKTFCKNGSISLVEWGSLLVTPWHPVLHKGKWCFPTELGHQHVHTCDAVYSFLLEDRTSSMIIENVTCITLGHGIKNDAVAEHAFYGTEKVVDELKRLSGWQEGLVEIESVRRDSKTNLVCGLVQSF